MSEHALARYRREKSLSLDDMAKLAGTSRQSIHRIEQGTQTPSMALVARLIEATRGKVRAVDFLPQRRA